MNKQTAFTRPAALLLFSLFISTNAETPTAYNLFRRIHQRRKLAYCNQVTRIWWNVVHRE